MTPISTGYDWDFDLIERYDTAIAAAAAGHGLDTYPNQIEIITSEQMLDAYASSGLWGFKASLEGIREDGGIEYCEEWQSGNG